MKIVDWFVDVIDLFFIESDLYDHPDDYAGSKLLTDLAAGDAYGKEDTGVPARGTRVNNIGEPLK